MNIWEKTFRDKEWGKYPPEELIRAVCEYTKDDKTKSVLEMGCGPGANSLFLNEHFQSYSAIDFSETAIEKLNYINHPETIQCIWSEVKDIKIIDSTAKLIDYKLIPIPSSFKVPMLGFSGIYEKVMDQILPLRNKISLHSPKLFFRRELYQECLELTSNFL